jgi:hypothetical protein
MLGGLMTAAWALAGATGQAGPGHAQGWALRAWETALGGGSGAEVLPALLALLAFGLIFFAGGGCSFGGDWHRGSLMRSIHLAIKDWRQTGHDIKTVFFLVIMPLMFTAFFGYTFGGNQTSDVPRPVVGLAIHDSGAWAGPWRRNCMPTIRCRVRNWRPARKMR